MEKGKKWVISCFCKNFQVILCAHNRWKRDTILACRKDAFARNFVTRIVSCGRMRFKTFAQHERNLPKTVSLPHFPLTKWPGHESEDSFFFFHNLNKTWSRKTLGLGTKYATRALLSIGCLERMHLKDAEKYKQKSNWTFAGDYRWMYHEWFIFVN